MRWLAVARSLRKDSNAGLRAVQSAAPFEAQGRLYGAYLSMFCLPSPDGLG